MDQIVKKVLKKIENNGYEAYVVGGYVRDLLLNNKSYDVDICTNALPKELNKIFPNCQNNNYGGINFKIKKFNFDITTYRKEIKYQNRRPVEIEYINNLFDDINRRDFKINAICMNSKGFIIDITNGREDIKHHLISMINNPDERLKEDPLRILRAIRFMTVLDFNLDKDLANALRSNYTLVLSLSNKRIKEEFDKILLSHNSTKGLDYLKEIGILEVLNINYKEIKKTGDLLGNWAQLDFSFNNAFTKEEKNNIINIRKILDYGTVDNYILYYYGLYLSLVAGEILGINKITINKKYKQLPIHNKKDLAINGEDLINILSIKPSSILSNIMGDIIMAILKKELKNTYSEIKKYVLKKRTEWFKDELEEDVRA